MYQYYLYFAKLLHNFALHFEKDLCQKHYYQYLHEAQEVCPLAVTGVKDETEKYTDENGDEKTRDVIQGIDTSLLVPLLTKSLQEALTRIDTLEAEVKALKGE